MPAGKVRDIVKVLKAIHAKETREAATAGMQAVIVKLRALRLRKAVDLLKEHGYETLASYGYPESHWLKLRTNNPLERIMREFPRTRKAGAFPDGQSCLNLSAARLRPIGGTQ